MQPATLESTARCATDCTRHRLAVSLFAAVTILMGGCGGAEDFSKPPAELAAARSKANRQSISQVTTPPAAAPARSEDGSQTDPTANTASEPETSDVDDKDSPASRTGKALAAAESSEQAKADSATDSSDTGNGVSLLDQLRAGKRNGGKNPTGEQDQPDTRRSKQYSMTSNTWRQIQNDLAKSFYVAVSDSGHRLAASSGRKSLGVLNVHSQDVYASPFDKHRMRGAETANQKKSKVTARLVTGLPHAVTCVELLQNEDVVLIGTEDGLLLTRSSVDLQNRDLYARDLLALQDEHRSATKIADSALTSVRRINNDLLLIVTQNDGTHVWKTSDVVPASIDPLQMSPEQARSPDPQVQNAQPVYSVPLPEAGVLSVTVSATQQAAAIVTSDAGITVFSINDGKTIARLSAKDFGNAQPVTTVPTDADRGLLIGLADGRILRQSLPAVSPVDGQNAQPVNSNFETIYTPESNDKRAAITAMAMHPDGRKMYIGRLDGILLYFDLNRNRILQSERVHAGPIVQICHTDLGLLTIGADRVARLSPATDSAVAATEFLLPVDDYLRQKVFVQSADLSPPRLPGRLRSRRDDLTVQPGLNPKNVRPSDPVLALYEHQLRLAPNEQQREQIRSRIQKLKHIAPSADQLADYEYNTEPRQLAELHTEFDFDARPSQRVAMSLAADGTTVATAHYAPRNQVRRSRLGHSIIVWDSFSGTQLRHWTDCSKVDSLDLNTDTGLLLPTPLTGRHYLSTGRLETGASHYLTSAISTGGDRLAVGLTGKEHAAGHVVRILDQKGTIIAEGVETFEGSATALAWSHDDAWLFVNVRERNRVRLLQLASHSLAVVNELSVEPIEGTYDPGMVDLQNHTLGATAIVQSPSGRFLVTYGRYSRSQSPYQLRIWPARADRWPRDEVEVISSTDPLVSDSMTDHAFRFVAPQDNLLAIVGPQGVGVIDLRSGNLKNSLTLPDVAGRRPVTQFSSDGRWVLAGDQDGNVWTWNLQSLKAKPRSFRAQAGPITGLALSGDGRYLATVGEENRLRIWDVRQHLKSANDAASVAIGRSR